MPNHHRRRGSALALLLGLGLAAPVRAQCPDGTPPPCAGAPRRAAPVIDARTWIVLPFANVARAPDIDWLREASVNLLYLDMSRWRDIRVIDDERVADLMRSTAADPSAAQSLQSGLAVARRVGAGKLVMGDLLKVGSSTQIVAKVYDVRNGQRLRSVSQSTSSSDSLVGAFSRLARAILDAEPPAGSALGALGTTRLEAYQEYLAGVRAMNAFNIPDASERLRAALALDSTFALAHYKLSVVLGWDSPSDTLIRVHAEKAARLSSGLPERERTLIAAWQQNAVSDYGVACGTYAGLLRRDSNDVDALYGLGECSFHDPVLVPLGGDTSRLAFQSSWNTALRSFRRVLELDPSYHLAFHHIGDALQAGMRPGCRLPSGRTVCRQADVSHAAAVLRDSDSLRTVPISLADGGVAFDGQQREALRSGSVRRNLEEARTITQRWVASGPGETMAHRAYGIALLKLGEVAEADRQLRLVTGRLGRNEAVEMIALRLEIAAKLDRGAEGRRLLDSVLASSRSQRDLWRTTATIAPMFGRLHPVDSLITSAQGMAPALRAWLPAAIRIFLGLPAESLAAKEQAVAAVLGPQMGARLTLLLGQDLFAAPFDRAPGDWPPTDTASADIRIMLGSFVATGDTTRIRRALGAYDSISASLPFNPDLGFSLLSARVHLLLGDSAVALARLTSFADSTWRYTPMLAQAGAVSPSWTGMLWPRTFLLQADLAAALGRADVARRACQRVIGFWEDSEQEFQPLVARARATLARLGP